MIRVVYNGEIHSPEQCSSPAALQPGKTYKVRYEVSHNDQNVYALEEPNGFFYTGWFVPVEEVATSFAFAKQVPEEGKCFQCKSVVLEHGTVRLSHAVVTAKAQVVEPIGKDTYSVMTHGKRYIVAVVK